MTIELKSPYKWWMYEGQFDSLSCNILPRWYVHFCHFTPGELKKWKNDLCGTYYFLGEPLKYHVHIQHFVSLVLSKLFLIYFFYLFFFFFVKKCRKVYSFRFVKRLFSTKMSPETAKIPSKLYVVHTTSWWTRKIHVHIWYFVS